MARKSERKITQCESYVCYEDGVRQERTTHRIYTIGSEDDYVKIYIRGLIYMRDMPPDCLRLLLFLLPYLRYAETPGSYMFNYGLTITIDRSLKVEIAKLMGYGGPNSISNVLTKLVDGGVLHWEGKGLYRTNPYLLGRGNVKDIAEVRGHYGHPPAPEATFMSVYQETKKKKKAQKEGLDPNQVEDDLGPIDTTPY